MKESNSIGKEADGRTVIEAIHQLKERIQQGCVGCSIDLIDADTVFGYAVQSPEEPVSELAHVTCADCAPIPKRRFTLGMRELIVRGHAGTIVNTRAQSTDQIILEPDLELVAPAHTDKPYQPDERVWPSGSLAERLGATSDEASVHTPAAPDGGQRIDGCGGDDKRSDVPEIIDDHLSGSYSFDGALEDSALPNLYVPLVVEPQADGLSVTEGPDDSHRLPDTTWEPRTLDEWLRYGLTQQLRREGVEVCHPWDHHGSEAAEVDWRVLPDNFHKPGVCATDSARCFLHELWGGPAHPGQLHRHPITFTAASSEADNLSDSVALEGLWRLTLTEVRPEYIGLITEAVSALTATQQSFALDLGDTHSVPVDIRHAAVVNPLYSPAEVQTALTSETVSGEMSAKRAFWTRDVRDGFIEALSDRLAMDQTAPPGGDP